MKKKRCLSLIILVLCINIISSACGHSIDNSNNTDIISVENQYGYSVRFIPLPEKMSLSTDQCSNKEKMYICGLDLQNNPIVCMYSQEESTQISLPENVSYIQACCMIENGVAILAGDYPLSWISADDTLRQNDTDIFTSFILIFDAKGNFSEKITLSSEICNGTNWDSLLWDNNYFYFMSTTDFLQVSKEGTLVNSMHLEGGCFISQALTESGIAISLFDSSADGGNDTVKIKKQTNVDRFTFDTIYTDDQLVLIGMGYDQQGNFLINLGERIVSLDAQHVEDAEIFNFNAAGMLNTYFPRLYSSPDGYLLANSNAKRITQLIYGELPEKEELLLWLPWGDDALNEWIEGFNLTNTQYSVIVERIDVSDAQSEDAVRAKIIAGNGPDMYFTGGESSFGSFNGSAVFENLLPYLDNSEQIHRDDLLTAVIDAVSEDSGLYTIPIDFTILTMSEQMNLLPQKDMSISDMLLLPDVQNGNLSVFPADMSQESLWYWLSSLYICTNLDEESGKCQFDTQEYIDLLRCCKSIQNFNAQDPVPSIFSFQQIPGLRRLIFLQKHYGDDIALFSGLGTAYYMEHSFAISNTSTQKDGAWQFIEYMLTTNLSKQEFSWPVSVKCMQKLIDAACSVGIWYSDIGDYKTLSPSNAELLWDFFDQSSGAGVVGKHPELIQIMKEESAKYFAGDKTAEEAAAMTQSRAQLYLAEQYG